MMVVTAVIALGIWLTYDRQTRELSVAPVVDLNSVSDTRILAPALHVFSTAAERESAARATLDWIRERGPLTHVGALARVTAASTKEPVFTTSGIAALKPGLVVRTQGAFRSRTLTSRVPLLSRFLASSHRAPHGRRDRRPTARAGRALAPGPQPDGDDWPARPAARYRRRHRPRLRRCCRMRAVRHPVVRRLRESALPPIDAPPTRCGRRPGGCPGRLRHRARRERRQGEPARRPAD